MLLQTKLDQAWQAMLRQDTTNLSNTSCISYQSTFLTFFSISFFTFSLIITLISFISF
jgi:hypothetical protein